MRVFTVVVVAVIVGGWVLPASAYSPIWNVDGWDKGKLEGAGITVASWKHDRMGEDPPLNWIKVTYDASKLREDSDVIMTLWLTARNGGTVCAFRAARTKGSEKTLKLLFASPELNSDTTRVEIVVLDALAAAAERPIGSPGFGGYRLSLNRILELVRPVSVVVPEESEGQ